MFRPPRGLLLALGVLLPTARVRADERALELSVSSDAGCEVSARIEDSVRKLTDGAEHAPPVRASARILRAGPRYRVVLQTEQLGEHGERTFEAATCDEAADATALVLSVMLSPSDTTETVKSQGFPAPKPAATDLPAAPPPERARRPEPTAVGFGVGPRAGVDLGALPAPTGVLGVESWMSLARLRLLLRGSYYVPRSTDEGPRRGTGAEVGLMTGALGSCYRGVSRPVSVEGCLAVEAGAASGEGKGLANPRRARTLWLALAPGVEFRAPTPVLPAVIGVEVPVPVVRPEFTVDGYGRVFRSTSVGFRAYVGADWVLP